MEAYYSSDEEIAWGPITLREIKGDLKRTVRKPSRRHTMPRNYQMRPETPCTSKSKDTETIPFENCLCQESMDKLNVSPTSTEYFTPNETLQTDNSKDFLEKLSKVINEPSVTSAYTSALENNNSPVSTNDYCKTVLSSNISNSHSPVKDNAGELNESYLKFVKLPDDRKTYFDIAKFQQTLVDPSHLLEDEAVKQYFSDDNLSDNSCSSFKNDAEENNIVVLISDEEHDTEVNNISDIELLHDNKSLTSNDVNSVMGKKEHNLYRSFAALSCNSIETSNKPPDCDQHRSCKNINSEMLYVQITEGSNNNKQSYSEKASFSSISLESVDYDLMEDSLTIDRENMCEKLYNSLCSEGNLSDEGYINADKSEGSEGIQSGEVRLPNDTQMAAVEEPGNYRFFSSILPTIQEKRSMSTSPLILPEIDLIQFDDSLASNNDSPQFNDTLDEINRLLGQDEATAALDDELIIENTPSKNKSNSEHLFTPSNTASGSCSHIPVSTDKQRPFKTPINVTPSWEKKQPHRSNIKKTPDNNFKVPQKPVRLKFTEPTPPRCAPAHLKNVVSPVALYIKNSPSFPLKQNVPQKELLKIVTSKIPKPAMKENFAELPEVIYKPSTKQINSKEKDVVLPPSIKRLNVKEPRITKHEGRIHQSASNKGSLHRKLLSNDITNASINSSVLDGSQDISILTSKQAFIK